MQAKRSTERMFVSYQASKIITCDDDDDNDDDDEQLYANHMIIWNAVHSGKLHSTNSTSTLVEFSCVNWGLNSKLIYNRVHMLVFWSCVAYTSIRTDLQAGSYHHHIQDASHWHSSLPVTIYPIPTGMHTAMIDYCLYRR